MDIDLNFRPHDNGSPTHAQGQETGGGVEQMQLYEQGNGYQMHVQMQAQKAGEEDPILQNYLFILYFITKTCPWLRCYRKQIAVALKSESRCFMCFYNMLQTKKGCECKLESITHTTCTKLSIEN
jgi:hypothetical protein